MKAVAPPGYFQAMGIPLLRGRLFTPANGRMPPLKRDMSSLLKHLHSIQMVVVINETMARRFWPGEDPLGKSFRFGPPSLKGPRVRILGVMGDARQRGLDRSVAPLIRGIVAERQPDAVVARVETMEALIGRSLAGRQNNVLLLGLFSGITLLLAALGLYATMAYLVAQRTQEIGVRMALGARVVASMLYGVTATDVLTYAGSVALLAVVMLAACYLPARRACRVDPMAALRAE